MSSPRSSIGAGCRPISGGADLNFVAREPSTFPGLTAPGSTRVRRQDLVRSSHGVRAVDQLRPHRASLRRQLGRAYAVVRRAVPCDGICSADVAGEPARHRGQPVRHASKLYAMGFRAPVKRTTLADANESRDWRIWSDLAALLIRRARKLYLGDSVLGVELDNTVYALDSSTIDLCLSLFSWAPFRTAKAAIKLHTLLDLRGAIPAFIHVSDGKLHDVNVLDMLVIEAGAFYVMDRGYVDFARLHALQMAGAFFVTRAKSPMDARRVYSAATDRSTGIMSDQQVMLNGHYSAKRYPQHLRRIRFKDPDTGKTLIFLTCLLYTS